MLKMLLLIPNFHNEINALEAPFKASRAGVIRKADPGVSIALISGLQAVKGEDIMRFSIGSSFAILMLISSGLFLMTLPALAASWVDADGLGNWVDVDSIHEETITIHTYEGGSELRRVTIYKSIWNPDGNPDEVGSPNQAINCTNGDGFGLVQGDWQMYPVKTSNNEPEIFKLVCSR